MRVPADLAGLSFERAFSLMRSITGDARSARLFYRDAVKDGRFDPERYFGARTGGRVRDLFRFEPHEVVDVVAEDGPCGTTRKAALRLSDGATVECVLIPQPGGARSTLCVSSQVGCAMGCAFCETARMGLARNMSAAEIVLQATTARAVLGWEFSNVVFMGMGEPLANLDALGSALETFFDVSGWNLAQDRVTVCTAGLADRIASLKALGWKRLNLSVSLNSAKDETRSALMPVNERWNLDSLARALADYSTRPNFFLGVNYCLLPGINDAEDDADAVARFCARVGKTMVNVIPYNPGTAPVARAPEPEEVERFASMLYARGLGVRRRETRGRGIMAGCGQLGSGAGGNGRSVPHGPERSRIAEDA